MIFYVIPFILILFYFKNNIELCDKNQIKFKSFLILITIIAGTRSEVGQDWVVYQNYFSSINITKTINDSWDTNNSRIFFEPGFFALNYLVKLIGLNYNFIPLLSCILLNFSLYKISNEVNGNNFFFISVFFGYSFLILEFAQVRQSLSISLFLIAFTYYLKTKNILTFLSTAMLALLFQYSSLVYIVIFLVTFLFIKLKNKSYKIILTVSLFLIFLMVFSLANNSFLLKLISPSALWSKINFHFTLTNKIGVGQILNSIFLIISCIYIYLSSKKINDLKSKTLYDFTIIFSLAIIMTILIFPNFYVFYSRMYVLGSILLGLSFSSIIFNNRQNFISVLFKDFIVIISWLSYFRILFMYKMEYFPYRSWLFN